MNTVQTYHTIVERIKRTVGQERITRIRTMVWLQGGILAPPTAEVMVSGDREFTPLHALLESWQWCDDPPARITVGRAALALGAAVEIDAVAYKKQG